jgi:hypothetical protein
MNEVFWGQSPENKKLISLLQAQRRFCVLTKFLLLQKGARSETKARPVLKREGILEKFLLIVIQRDNFIIQNGV